ncbi:TetR/AcrR family transcriptional regulator [Sphingobacterium suaedae]|uniref:TetR/AcrR family transcriptional regulator n=1 Tax=Sphingobacterium suaedae TaxID=1686402 RepID=A0ABW5KF02_9SPHI
MTEKKRDANRTKKKLLDAVGTILATQGFTELKVNTICDEAGVDKKLIYFHFGDLNGLISEFLRSHDFWMTEEAEVTNVDKDVAFQVFRKQFESLDNSDLLKRLLVWELSEPNEILRKLADAREELGDELIARYKAQQQPGQDVHPIFALLVSGIYYLTIHSAINGSAFCGLDLQMQADKDRLFNGIKRVIDNCV